MTKIKKFVKGIRDYRIIKNIKEKEKFITLSESLYPLNKMKENSLNYVRELQVAPCKYRFSKSVDKPTLYAAVYAFMIQAWFGGGDIDNKEEWIKYFNSYQREDGLFADVCGSYSLFEKGDGWGARHLAGHMIIAYAKLGVPPDKEFKVLEFLRNPDAMVKFLNELDFRNKENGNKIMNYGVLLQYSRDYFGIDKYNNSISALEEWLIKHVNAKTGLWNIDTKTGLHEWVNFSYHLWPILAYDNIEIPFAEKAIDTILDNQNCFGGFSPGPTSNACSDIDSIEPLIRLSALNNHYRDDDIRVAITKAYPWVMTNQEDGGYMFEYGRTFMWGGAKNLNLYSKRCESNIFATWFRLLSIIYMNQYLGVETCKLKKIPGYEMPV